MSDDCTTCARCGHRIRYERSRLFFGIGEDGRAGTYRTCSNPDQCRARQEKQGKRGKEVVYP